ncbi:hypothetical protein OQA88_12228 [Cercophora sp. LCS_1]
MTARNKRSSRLPYLHRNWTKNISSLDTGISSKMSAQSREAGLKGFGLDDQLQRTAKRRRLDNSYDGFPLFEDYGTSSRALRVEVLKIFHKDSGRFKGAIMSGLINPVQAKDIVHVKARCKLTISGVQGGQSVVLHVDSQVCELQIFKNPAASSSPMVRFPAIKPFIIPEDKIYLERDDDAVFGLAQSYSVLVELESAGGPNWPPLDLMSGHQDETVSPFFSRTQASRQLVLNAAIPDIFHGRHRKEIQLRIKNQSQQDTATNFRMDVDVRWFTCISSQLARRGLDKDVQPSITVFDGNEPLQPLANGVVNGINGANGINGVNINGGGIDSVSPHEEPLPGGENEKPDIVMLNGTPAESTETPTEGDLTPGRARRNRQEVNYNVKQMWATAVGKEPRKRRRAEDAENSQLDAHVITYNLPPEQVQADRFSCLICGAENENLSQLRAHYLSHPQYEFSFEMKRGGCVVHVKSGAFDTIPLRPRVYQLGLPVKPLDLDKYLEGDESWVNSRLGPENGRDVQAKFPHVKVPQTKKIVSRRVSKKKILVPNIKQPLYDPRSKAQLVPGTEVRQLPIDEDWLIRKHREALTDFEDLEAEEMEFMKEWNGYILRKHISSQQYLPRAFLSFVKEKASWIVAKPSRADEFSRHVGMLLARRVLEESVIVEATQRLNEARAFPRPVEEPKEIKSSAGGCTDCGKPVGIADMLICGNKQCEQRLYHGIPHGASLLQPKVSVEAGPAKAQGHVMETRFRGTKGYSQLIIPKDDALVEFDGLRKVAGGGSRGGSQGRSVSPTKKLPARMSPRKQGSASPKKHGSVAK